MPTKKQKPPKSDAKMEAKIKQAITEFTQSQGSVTSIDSKEQVAKWRSAVLNELKKTQGGIEVIPAKIFKSIKEVPIKHIIKKIPGAVKEHKANIKLAATTIKDIHQKTVNVIKQTKLPSHWRFWLHITEVVLLAVFIYVGLNMMRFDRRWSQVAKFLPWPAAYTNGHLIMLSELDNNAAPVIKIYQDRLGRALYSEEIAKIENNTLDKLVRNQLVADFITEKNIHVTQDMINSARDDFKASFADEQAMREFVAKSYGWTYQDFEQNIMMPYLRQSAFENYLLEQPNIQLAAKQKAGLYRDQINSGLVDFATLAMGKSDDTNTNQQGGDLGWVQPEVLEPNMRKIVSELKIGQISEPVRSPYAYHIFKITDINNEGSELIWHLSHIMVNIVNIDTWLKHELQFDHTYKLVRIY